MSKRNIGQEILAGIQEIKAHKAGETTLCTHERKASTKEFHPQDPSNAEIDLSHQINQDLPEATRLRFRALKEKRDAAILTPTEYEELLAIIDQIEAHDVERLRALIALAQLRGITLDELMAQLGIHAPPADF